MSKICDIEKLEEIRKLKKVTIPELCKNLKMDVSTYYRKIKNNGNGFTVGEITAICDALSLTDDESKAIFFVPIVA